MVDRLRETVFVGDTEYTLNDLILNPSEVSVDAIPQAVKDLTSPLYPASKRSIKKFTQEVATYLEEKKLDQSKLTLSSLIDRMHTIVDQMLAYRNYRIGDLREAIPQIADMSLDIKLSGGFEERCDVDYQAQDINKMVLHSRRERKA